MALNTRSLRGTKPAYLRGGVLISREEAKIEILEAVGGTSRVVGGGANNHGRVMLPLRVLAIAQSDGFCYSARVLEDVCTLRYFVVKGTNSECQVGGTSEHGGNRCKIVSTEWKMHRSITTLRTRDHKDKERVDSSN
jgi:hypothetical protein